MQSEGVVYARLRAETGETLPRMSHQHQHTSMQRASSPASISLQVCRSTLNNRLNERHTCESNPYSLHENQP